ncbi:hypothetical protein I3760_15G067900 [Carya illinoinensis]|nr:hypothetical protein I3760_15G067900 [Carya illinoinensis]
MGLQVLLDKNLTSQTVDVLPLKVVFRPFDRGRERTPVGINCDDQDVVDELGMGSNGGALSYLGVLIGREFSVEDLLIILDKIFASVNGKLDKGAEEDIESNLNSPRGAFISATAVSMFLYLRSYLPTNYLSLRGCLVEHCSPDDVDSCNGNQNLRGLAIVTCCHHLVRDKVTLKILMDSENMVEILTVLWFAASMVEGQACRISGLGVQIIFLKNTWTVNKRQLPQRLSFAHSMIFHFDSSCLMLANVQVVKSVSNGHLLQLKYLALRNLVTVFLQQGSTHYEDALHCYPQAVEINTIDSVVWNQLGTISCSMELFSLSRWAFEQGPSCRPYNWNGMEKLLEVNDFSIFYCSSLRPNGKAMIELRFRGLLNHSMSLLKKKWLLGILDDFTTKQLPHNVTWGLSLLYAMEHKADQALVAT